MPILTCGNPVPLRQFGEQCGVEGDILVDGRDRHQPLDPQAQLLAAEIDKGREALSRNAGFPLLVTGVNLDQQARVTVLFRDFLGQGVGKAWPVQGLDDVE